MNIQKYTVNPSITINVKHSELINKNEVWQTEQNIHDHALYGKHMGGKAEPKLENPRTQS